VTPISVEPELAEVRERSVERVFGEVVVVEGSPELDERLTEVDATDARRLDRLGLAVGRARMGEIPGKTRMSLADRPCDAARALTSA
jgi:hypothetical protein